MSRPPTIILCIKDGHMTDVKARAPTLNEAAKHLRVSERDFEHAEARLAAARRQHAEAERPRNDGVRTALLEAGLVLRCPESDLPHDDVVQRLVSTLARQGLELTETRR